MRENSPIGSEKQHTNFPASHIQLQLFFPHSIALLILFSKCCLCPPGGGFSIYGGVLRGCEPITVSQPLCACLSTLWLEKEATQLNTHTRTVQTDAS